MEEKKTPKSWISTLAEQSWEAELIVSGIAIFGALNLPRQLEFFIDFLLLNLPEDYLFFGSYLVLYLFAGIQVMIAGFLIHFVFRVLWIGFVGLYSVYPERKHIQMYSDDFNQKLDKDFPGLESYIKTLDDASSLVFAAANSGILAMFSVIITGSLLIGLSALVHQLLPDVSIKVIVAFSFVLIFLPSILTSILHLKFLREKEWVKKIHYPLYMQYSKVFLNIAFKPLNYLLLTFYSNVKAQRLIFLFGGVIFLLGMFSGGRLANSNFKYYVQERFFDIPARTDYANADYYEDQRDEENIVIHAMIPSRQLKSPYLDIFLPAWGRERTAKNDLCGTYQDDEDLSEEENTQESRKFRIECLKEFYQFYVDDSLYRPIEMVFNRRDQRSQKGYMATLDLGHMEDGRHMLTIKKEYHDSRGKQAVIHVPFIYTQFPPIP